MSERRRRRRRRRQIYSGANAVNEEDSERERYPGVEDLISRAAFPGETHPNPFMLLYCEVK